MTAAAPARAPFGRPGEPSCEDQPGRTPLDRLLDRLLDGLAARLGDLAGPVTRVAELRGTVVDGRGVPQRFYCSLQARDPVTGRFDAWTAHWSRGSDGASWCRVPADPRLPGLATALGTHDDVEVLRYVPLRRFTYRDAGRVTKVKRRSRLDDSWTRARHVEDAVTRRGRGAGPRLRVPRLLGVDHAASSYSQADVDGEELARLARGDRLDGLLAEAGAVHAAFHTLDAPGLPHGPSCTAVRDTTLTDVAWAAWLLPELRGPLVRAVDRLQGAPVPPPRPDDVVTCHGDLVPSHLLGAPGRWTVIDHDLAHRGDRYRDVAMFVAGLAHDVPDLHDGAAADPTHARAVEAYLGGYESVLGRRLDRRRLARHLLAAHLHHAALLASKDRADDVTLAGTARRLEAATADADPPGGPR